MVDWGNCCGIVVGKTAIWTFPEIKLLNSRSDRFSLLNEVLDIEEEDTEDEEGDSASIENGIETHSRFTFLEI